MEEIYADRAALYKKYADITLNEQGKQIRETVEMCIRDSIFERYKYIVRKKAKAMFLAGGDSDDLIQEGMIGLYKACLLYTSALMGYLYLSGQYERMMELVKAGLESLELK